MDRPDVVSAGTNSAQGSTSESPGNTSSYRQYEALLKAARSGSLDAIEKFLKDHPEAVNARITSDGETALHIATMFGHLHIVEKLVQLMSEDDLELKNRFGNTALHYASFNGNENNSIKAVKCMVEKNKMLLTTPSDSDWIPVTHALNCGRTEMGRYLYSVTPFEELLPENGVHGADLLNFCYYFKMFDMALDLARHCPTIALGKRQDGGNFCGTLATAPSPCLDESQLPFWRRWLYIWVHVQREPAFAINKAVIDMPETAERRDHYVRGKCRGLLHRLVWNTLHLLGIGKIYEASLAHKQYLELVRAVCNAISSLNEEEIGENRIRSAVLNAARRGNAKFIMEAIKAHFSLVWSVTGDGKRLFLLAVQYRQAKVFDLIHGLSLKPLFSNDRDHNGNCMLHMAGLLAPPAQLNNIPGALLQMQRELQWFQEVESITPPWLKEWLNSENMTPRELFTREHMDLVKQGEKWTKGTGSSCGVVAALVATITFAAAFTVPGGNDQIKGYPVFLHEKLFMLFMISNAASLFSSSTSLLMFLGLLTARYAEDDFLKSLPTRLIIGLSTMFVSLATMMIAFCAALFLMLQSKLWIVIPVTLLASVPVALYIWLQLPLLVEIYKSTYGPGIFDRNIKPWL